MPTLNWIQETAINRLWERGTDSSHNPVPLTYTCRQCTQVFDTITLRDLHELEHPVKNPVMSIRGREVLEDRLRLTHTLAPYEVEFSFVEQVFINGNKLQKPETAGSVLSGAQNGFIEVVYANDISRKKVNIELCISKQDELDSADYYFQQLFSRDDFDSSDIDRFITLTNHCGSIKNYVHGLVRYLHGILAKDRRTCVVSFENFTQLLNESMQYLGDYETHLSCAIRGLIRFNFNDFRRLQAGSGLPALDQSLIFFTGGRILTKPMPSGASKIPVDYATALAVRLVTKQFISSSFPEIESEISSCNPRHMTLQDRNKFHYIAYRKAIETDKEEKIDHYARYLSYDDAFSNLLSKQGN